MTPTTVARLAALNRRFYAEHAAAFSASRSAPWRGWGPIVAGLPPPAEVLDVGAGNGRFGRFLAARLAAPASAPGGAPAGFRYVLVEPEPALVAAARRLGLPSPHEVVPLDVLADPLPPGPFDWVVAFGLLHHVPSVARREALVDALWARTRGALVLSFWSFAATRTDALVGAELEALVDPADLEPGDHVLRFQGRGARYCHSFEDREIDALVRRLDGEPGLDLRADGPTGQDNRYVAISRPAR